MYAVIGDINLNEQAHAVLALLKGNEISGKNDDDYISVETSAWYNCRERGYAITISKGFKAGSLVITFGEHRNSDSIFVDEWEMQRGINPPTVNDFTDEAYENRKHFSYGECGKTAQYIMTRIRAYIDRVPTEGR